MLKRLLIYIPLCIALILFIICAAQGDRLRKLEKDLNIVTELSKEHEESATKNLESYNKCTEEYDEYYGKAETDKKKLIKEKESLSKQIYTLKGQLNNAKVMNSITEDDIDYLNSKLDEVNLALMALNKEIGNLERIMELQALMRM